MKRDDLQKDDTRLRQSAADAALGNFSNSENCNSAKNNSENTNAESINPIQETVPTYKNRTIFQITDEYVEREKIKDASENNSQNAAAEKSISRRELFSSLLPMFGEKLAQTLRSTNNLLRDYEEQLKKK